MANMPKQERVKVRTAQAGVGPQYVIVAGAPQHYITGYGLVGPGDIVTLPEGCKPGRYLQAVNPADVAKVQGDEDQAAVLAERAKERADAEAAKDADKSSKK